MALSKIAPIQPPQVDLGTQVVDIIVGTERKVFTIHSQLLFATSPVFEDYIFHGNSNMFLGPDNTIRTESGWDGTNALVLPDTDPLLIQLFRDWLYSGRIPDNVSCYIKPGDECQEDLFWWRVLKLGGRLLIDHLTALAERELEGLFSEDQPTVPSSDFVASVFDEGLSWELSCWQGYIIEHAAFWLERSANRDVWYRLVDGHKHVPRRLLGALISVNQHPCRRYPSGGCMEYCCHVLADSRFEVAPTPPAEQSQANRTLLTRARLITDEPIEAAQSDADWNNACGWQSNNHDCGHAGCDEDCWESDNMACSEGLAVATPSQSTIRERPTEAAPPVPSQQAPSPLPTSPEHDQHVNTKQAQDLLKEIGGSSYADLVAKFSTWLLNEASVQNGVKGHEIQQTASTFKHEENSARTAPTSIAADLKGHTEPTVTGAVNNDWASLG
ncbi:hypothetical protein PV11_06909 [Exophiala sideris]|uniref:BTB domain-containing protein n=1 Tax=Exophiala sideris TaxID=1016849 RepID=A0A0D1YWZ4_9EURO|nr:hypothetical protein PV11_06909 [Exophiala sideris]